VGRVTDSGRVVARRVFTPVASVLLRLKVSPDAVTVIGTVGTAAAALYFYPKGEFLAGTLVIALFVFSDSLDGTMARLAGTSVDVGRVSRLHTRPGRRCRDPRRHRAVVRR
jgi:CDP-diacylglycerol--glycerol-3-phosphate 3-phosphatidyltransferase